MFITKDRAGCSRIYLKRIHIEKLFSIQLDTADGSIVKFPFHDIGINSKWFYFQHSLCKKDHSYRRAGLRICHIVWQIIVNRKCLALNRRTDAAGDVHSFLYNIIPQSLTRLIKSLIFIFPGKVCHRRVHINGTHTVPNRLFLLIDRGMCLRISLI